MLKGNNEGRLRLNDLMLGMKYGKGAQTCALVSLSEY